MARFRGKQAVYIVITPDDFRPQRAWDFPPEFVSATLFARNLTMSYAHGFARTHNKAALLRSEQGDWDHKWAIVAKHIKSQQHGVHPLAKGGAV